MVLPGIDGIDLMKRIPELAELPVGFISGYDNDETIARGARTGAADYIVKPFSPTIAGRKVELTATEYYELLRVLSQNSGRVLPTTGCCTRCGGSAASPGNGSP
ncbi:response regulator transcription factor [Candidatus Palauibacter sp.]|uniref:response regulator transcription factor n=1 Tax=Candidatus Palauibacter sp. TaxID=3101350 RepID=UPI003D09AE44